MKKAGLLCGIICIAVLLGGCKPTPATDAVINKNDGALQSALDKVNERVKYDIPANWSDEFINSKGDFSVEIRADISFPDTDHFPVYTVAPRDMTMDDFDKYISVYMGNETAYNTRPGGVRTKAEIDNEILRCKMALNDPDSDLNSEKESLSAEAYASAVAYFQSEISQLEQEKRTAPDILESVKFDHKWIDDIGDGKLLRMSVETKENNDIIKTLGVMKRASNKANSINIFTEKKDYSIGGMVLKSEENSPYLKTTYSEAVNIANEFIDSLGFTDMKVTTGGRIPAYPSSRASEYKTYEERLRCYAFYATRMVGSAQATYTSNSGFGGNGLTDSKAYAEQWPDEYIFIAIDDSGVMQMSYHTPLTVKSTRCENVELLPFDEIKQRFLKQIELSGSFNNDEKIISKRLVIEQAVFGYARISVKGNQNEGLLVPVWDFYGYVANKYPDGYDSHMNENNELISTAPFHSFLTINAIDGSIIERETD